LDTRADEEAQKALKAADSNKDEWLIIKLSLKLQLIKLL
jgi:hypothetical protein